jgi:hypothetical protein
MLIPINDKQILLDYKRYDQNDLDLGIHPLDVVN